MSNLVLIQVLEWRALILKCLNVISLHNQHQQTFARPLWRPTVSFLSYTLALLHFNWVLIGGNLFFPGLCYYNSTIPSDGFQVESQEGTQTVVKILFFWVKTNNTNCSRTPWENYVQLKVPLQHISLFPLTRLGLFLCDLNRESAMTWQVALNRLHC